MTADEHTYTRVVEVELTETTTRVAHIEVTSREPIDTDRLLEGGDLHDNLIDQAEDLAAEKDGGREAEVTIIDPAEEDRYQLSLDGEFDLDED